MGTCDHNLKCVMLGLWKIESVDNNWRRGTRLFPCKFLRIQVFEYFPNVGEAHIENPSWSGSEPWILG